MAARSKSWFVLGACVCFLFGFVTCHLWHWSAATYVLNGVQKMRSYMSHLSENLPAPLSMRSPVCECGERCYCVKCLCYTRDE